MTASADMPTPAFVQQVSAHRLNVAAVSVTPAGILGANDRLIVEVGIWNSAHSTAKSVVDAAGNTYTMVAGFIAADGTEQSVWTAPVTVGVGTKPAITVTPTAKADVGVAVVEYSGLSALGGTAAVDTKATASGLTGSAAATTVSSGATGTVSGANELAVSFYADSGFGDTLTAGDGLIKRVSVAPTSDMELLVEDRLTMAGDTPNGGVGTGKNTSWLMSTIVFRTAATTGPTVPGAPTGVQANPGNASATVTLVRSGRRRKPDHLTHRAPLGGAGRPDPRHRESTCADDHDLRPDQRHRLYVHGQRDQCDRHRARFGGIRGC